MEEVARGIRRVARNLWWVWNPDVRDFFAALSPSTHRQSKENPLAVLNQVEREGQNLMAAIVEKGLLEDARQIVGAFDAYMSSEDTWYLRECAEDPSEGPVAYFSAEFGLCASLPIYSGGLGVLAGDHVKAASDLGIPFVGVGLLYHHGYFRQEIDEDGAQSAFYPRLDLEDAPLSAVLDAEGQPLMIAVPVGEQMLAARVWRVEVGRVSLYLLDTDVEGNSERARTVTDNLYGGGTDLRIVQEILLGVGGVRAIRAMGLEPQVWHLNEGHCAFLGLELLREHIEAGVPFFSAWKAVTQSCVFTTHTPVPAGHDRFEKELVERRLGWILEPLDLTIDELMALGGVGATGASVNLDLPEPSEADEAVVETGADSGPEGDGLDPLCMTVLALRMCRAANGVSMVHGEVSRQMWAGMWPDRAASDVPIGHVTNGVHLQTWCAGPARRLLERRQPRGWKERRDDPELWLDYVDGLSDDEIWTMRQTLKDGLIGFIEERCRVRSARLPRQDAPPQFRRDVMTIGFARRFATYKRADLIFDDLERSAALFNDPDRPIQLVFAGKAHPMDAGGQSLIRRLTELSQRPEFAGKVALLEDYDMVMGRRLVSGVDVWLNNPRKPREASGTSGQKVAIHGGLNLSVLDGWWPEGFDGTNGFAIGDATAPVSPREQDARDAQALYSMLEGQVLPLYYDRGPDGIPHLWVRRVRMAMKTLVGRFTTYRMVKDYARLFYEL